MGHLHTFKKPKKNATNPAITISQRNTISNNVLLLLCTVMPAMVTQLEGCCCKIKQCSVSPSYNALLQKQQFAPIHHHIMLMFHHLVHHHSMLCCTIIQYNLLHPITMLFCINIQFFAAPL